MTYRAYVAVGGEDKILIFGMDPESGQLTLEQDIVLDGGPGPLCADPEQKFLYVGIRSTREILSYRVDGSTGGLSRIGSVSVESDPCYLATDRKGRFLLSAYYGDGLAAVHPIGEDGAAIGPPVEWRTTAVHAHCMETDRSNRFAFVPHTVPSNAIFQFVFDEESGALTPNAVPMYVPDTDEGPRHLCFHPSSDFAYCSNEQGSSVTAYRFDPSSGTLSALQTLSTLPEGYTEDNTCAQIHITPSGKWLYVSNRGHDSIACFAVDADTGELTALGQQPSEPIPRAFNVDLTGNYLFAGSQPSGRLASYRIDGETGTLNPLETYEVGEQVMWVLVLAFQD